MITATGTKTTTTSVTRNPNRRGHRAVLAVLFAMGALAAQADTLWVDPAASSSPGTGCGILAEYKTIQAAVDAALPGDTIMVCKGMYYENVSIAKAGLIINGAQAGNAVAGRLSAGPLESTVHGANPIGANPVFKINAVNVTID